MLQFLQYKVFGKHTVPEGWVIVTAGNPPEYNKAVREFDVVTLDRLKVIKIEADYRAWKNYARTASVHGAIMGFLESNRDSFYKVETTVYGKNYVTARGWEDLSDMIKMYEEDNKPVNDSLISQYITDEKIAKDFSAYYDLYNKYKKQYDVESMFIGNLTEDTVKAVSSATVDERLALTGLLADTLKQEAGDILGVHRMLMQIRPGLSSVASAEQKEVAEKLSVLLNAAADVLAKKSRAGSLSAAEKTHNKRIIKFYTDAKKRVNNGENIKDIYNEKIVAHKNDVERELARIDNLFEGMDRLFGADSNEMLVLVTEMTLNQDMAEFFSEFSSPAYEKYNSVLKVGDRASNLRKEIKDLKGL